MMATYATLGRKFLSLALMFNSLMSLIAVGSILAGFYAVGSLWQPYSPYLVEGLLLCVVTLTASLNIVPSKIVGNVHIKRIFFHHYVYGFLTMIGSVLIALLLMPKSLDTFFTLNWIWGSISLQNLRSLAFYAELSFIYGLTMLLDDFSDISSRMGSVLNLLKVKVYKSGKTINSIHLLTSLITLYLSLSMFLSYTVFTVSLLINGLWGLNVTRKKIWFRKDFFLRKI